MEAVHARVRYLMGEVIESGIVTRLDIDPMKVIRGAEAANMQTVVIMGYDESGEEYFASSIANRANVLWLTERLRTVILTDED